MATLAKNLYDALVKAGCKDRIDRVSPKLINDGPAFMTMLWQALGAGDMKEKALDSAFKVLEDAAEVDGIHTVTWDDYYKYELLTGAPGKVHRAEAKLGVV